jgi:flagellin-specific chaperone FliS
MNTIKTMYSQVECAIKLNGRTLWNRCKYFLHHTEGILSNLKHILNNLCKTCNSKLFLYNYINNRLLTWLDTRDIIQDEQNNFRKSKSTIDHLSTLKSIIETRKLLLSFIFF